MPEEGEKFRTVDQYWFVIFLLFLQSLQQLERKDAYLLGLAFQKKKEKKA